MTTQNHCSPAPGREHWLGFLHALLPLLLTLMVTPAARADAVNLVTNGGFEQLDDKGAPVGWERFKPHFAQIAEDPAAGKILRVTSLKDTGQPMVSQRFDIPAGVQRVWIVTRMRAVNVKPGEERYMSPRVQLAQFDADDKVLGYGQSPMLREDAEWTDFGYWYDLKEGATQMLVGAGFNRSTGVAEFDGISVWTDMPTQDQLAAAYPPASQTNAITTQANEAGLTSETGRVLENLVTNGDFETVMADGTLAHWTNADKPYVQVLTEDGNRFLRITQDGSHARPFIQQRIEFADGLLGDGGSKVWVSVRMRGRNVIVGEQGYENPRVQLAHFDADGELLGYGWSPKIFNDTDGWTTVSGWYSLRPGKASMTVAPGININASGVVDFDDLSVTLDQPKQAVAKQATINPAPVWTRGIERVIHVDPSHAAATDSGTGTVDRPFKSLGAGVAAADQSKMDNVGTRLVIAPGEYREPLHLTRLQRGDDTQAPLIIEARDGAGTVTLYGSERWVEGWEPVPGKPGVYQHHWPYDWGLSGNPWENWGNERGSFDVPVPDIAQRWENIFVADEPLRQFLDIAELTDASFYVDEEGDRLVVDFPGNMTPRQAQPEIALRHRILLINGRTNVTVRGLTLKHAASGLKRYTALMVNGIGYTLEDFTSTLHGGGGLSSNKVDHYTWRNVKLNRNGLNGGGFSSSRNVDIDGLEVSFNNWRGDWGDWATWSPCGMKNMANDGVIMRNVVAQGNLSHGLWLDWQNENFVVDGLIAFNNVGYGFYNEANPGPIVLRNAILVNNRDGIHHANTVDFTLEDSIVMNNRNGAISLRERVGRFSTSRFTGEKTIVSITDWKMWNNIIVQENGGFLVLTPGLPNHLTALRAEGNLWYTSTPEKAFQVRGLGYTFEDWQLLTGTALGDYFGPPKLTGSPLEGYTPAEDSPLHVRESWPVVHVENPGMGALASRLQSRVESTWAERYELTRSVSPGRFQPIDISGAVNRGVRTPGGWIGIPITQIASGPAGFHGVPFELLDEADHGGFAGVMLRSDKFTETHGKPLPAQVSIPVNTLAEAVYVLHVAGYAQDFTRAAKYTLVYRDGTEHAVGIDVLGASIDNVEEESVGPIIAEAEVQDWWPTNRQFSHGDSKRLMVTPQDDPMSAPRFLYTTQIKNPHPDKPIREIRLASEGSVDATIMVLGITLMR